MKWKQVVCSFVSIYLDRPQLDMQQKQTVWNFRLLVNRYAQFWLFRKGTGIEFSAKLVYGFSREIFLMLYYINCPTFIVWLPLLLEVLGNICVAIVCFPGCDVINLKINLIYRIKPFLYMTKKRRQKFKYLKNKKSI